MPFQVRSTTDPGTAADNWSTGVGNSGQKLATGYAAPRRDPQKMAVAASGRWLNSVTAAKPAYESGVGGYNTDDAIASMQANGVSRYTQAATTKKDNYSRVAAKLIPALRSIAAGLPADRSTPAARDARALAQIQQARALRGKFRKGNTR